MATTTEKIIDVQIKGVSSVKELKEQIKDLRDRLVRLDETSEDYKKTVDELIEDEKKLTSVMKAGKNEVSAATGSYNALTQEMSALKKVWKEVTSEAERDRIGKRIAEINVQLKAMDASIGNFQRNVGDYEGAIKRAFVTPQQEIKALRVQLAGLVEGTKEYNEVFMRMADLTTKVQKQQELLKYSSADLGNILSNLAGVAAGVVGGFSAVNAAMGLMGEQDSDVQAAMLKVQQFMALVQGISAMEGLGDKIKGLWNGITKFIEGFRGGATAVSNFEKETKKAEGTTEQVSTELAAQANVIQTNTVATEQLATAKKELSDYENQELARIERSIGLMQAEVQALQNRRSEYAADIQAKGALEAYDKQHIQNIDNEIQRLEVLIARAKEQRDAILGVSEAKGELSGAEKSSTNATNASAKAEQGLAAAEKQSAAAAKTESGAIKSDTDEKVKDTLVTKGLTFAKKALTVATRALGAAIAAIGIGFLIGLLSKGVEWLIKWASGAKKAQEQTDALKKSTEELNVAMKENEETMDFQSRLMEAQGKEYDEIYNYKKQQITADLNLAKAHLKEAEAQAVAIGQKKLAKKKYDDFRETLEELRKTVKETEKELVKLDQEKIIHDAREANKPKGGGGGGNSAYDSQLKAAQNLYKQLQDFYKTDRQKLKETYEENKKTIDKYIKNKADKNKALLLLDKKYYDDLKELTRKNMDAIYGIYMGQENRRLALMNVWGDKYIERAKAVLDEEKMIALRGAAQKVGFQEKSDADVARMDAATKKEYLERQKLFNNEKYLIEQEYEKKYNKLVADNNRRQIEEERRAIEIKKENAKTDEEVLAAEIELAEFNLAHADIFSPEEESANEYQLRVIALTKALEELQKKQKELSASKDFTQLGLDNDALQAKIDNGENSMQYYDARIKAAQYYYDTLKQMQGESNEEFRQRQLQALDELTQLEKGKLQQRLDNYSNLANGIGDIFGSIADIYQTEIQAQKDADGEYNAESKKKFEYVKNLQIAQATIQTISGAIAAFMSCQSLGFPWGQIIGGVQAAAVTAAGIAQIAQIRKTKLDGSGGGSSNSTKYAVAVPSITDYNPQGTTNLTNGKETEDLANALSKTNIVVSVTDINEVQDRVKTRVVESTF